MLLNILKCFEKSIFADFATNLKECLFVIKELVLLQLIQKSYIKFDKVEVICCMNGQIIEFYLLKPGNASAEDKKQPGYIFLKANLVCLVIYGHLR